MTMLVGIFVFLAEGTIGWLMWQVVAPVIGLPLLSWGQSLCLLVLCNVLFKSTRRNIK